jgi:hypothetical protein
MRARSLIGEGKKQRQHIFYLHCTRRINIFQALVTAQGQFIEAFIALDEHGSTLKI